MPILSENAVDTRHVLGTCKQQVMESFQCEYHAGEHERRIDDETTITYIECTSPEVTRKCRCAMTSAKEVEQRANEIIQAIEDEMPY